MRGGDRLTSHYLEAGWHGWALMVSCPTKKDKVLDLEVKTESWDLGVEIFEVAVILSYVVMIV